MDNSKPTLDIGQEIKPFAFYPLKAVAGKLGYTSRTKVAELAKELKAQGQGNSKMVLGENILVYMSSPTLLTQQMQPNQTGLGNPTQEEILNTKPNTNEVAGAAIVK